MPRVARVRTDNTHAVAGSTNSTKVLIEFYHSRDLHDAHAIAGRAMQEAVDLEEAIGPALQRARTPATDGGHDLHGRQKRAYSSVLQATVMINKERPYP